MLSLTGQEIYIYHNCLLKNCIIAHNTATTGCGGVFVCPTNNSNSYNDIWNNTPSDTQNYSWGTGDISSDPLFVDPAAGNYRLQWGSSCIDAGDPDSAYNDSDGTRNDMGAFYYNQVSVEEKRLEEKFEIELIPNPFLHSTIIKYYLSVKTKVSLKIYDISGRTVKTLVNGEQKAGSYNINLNTKGLTAGIYFVRLEASNFKETKKLTILK